MPSIWQRIGAFFRPKLDDEIRAILAHDIIIYLGRWARIRTIFAGALAVMGAYSGIVLEHADWMGALHIMLGYFLLALATDTIINKQPGGASWLRWSIPLIDIPFAFFGIYSTLSVNPYPQVAACFAIMGGIGFVLLSPVEESPVAIVIATVEGFLLSSWILNEAGVNFPAWVPSTLLAFGVVGFGALQLRHRSLRIATQYAKERRASEHLGRFFSPNLTEYIGRRGGLGEVSGRRQITVLFSDLRGFTRMSEKMDPQEVVDLLNEYFGAMVEVIFQHDGTLDKFIGDGIMAYFGAPQEQTDQAARAIHCALDMADALEKINEGRSKKLKIGVGVHSGPVILGEVGSHKHKDFTAIGDTVNLASRIEAITKEKKQTILVSEATYRECKDEFNWRATGSVRIRGKTKPVKLYTPRER